MDISEELQQIRAALECIRDYADISYALHLVEQLEQASEQLKIEDNTAKKRSLK